MLPWSGLVQMVTIMSAPETRVVGEAVGRGQGNGSPLVRDRHAAVSVATNSGNLPTVVEDGTHTHARGADAGGSEATLIHCLSLSVTHMLHPTTDSGGRF
jgi:hypothetical protein